VPADITLRRADLFPGKRETLGILALTLTLGHERSKGPLNRRISQLNKALKHSRW
jgi:hypothetical protein